MPLRAAGAHGAKVTSCLRSQQHYKRHEPALEGDQIASQLVEIRGGHCRSLLEHLLYIDQRAQRRQAKIRGRFANIQSVQNHITCLKRLHKLRRDDDGRIVAKSRRLLRKNRLAVVVDERADEEKIL